MEAIIGVEVRRKEVMAREYSCRKCLPPITIHSYIYDISIPYSIADRSTTLSRQWNRV